MFQLTAHLHRTLNTFITVQLGLETVMSYASDLLLHMTTFSYMYIPTRCKPNLKTLRMKFQNSIFRSFYYSVRRSGCKPNAKGYHGPEDQYNRMEPNGGHDLPSSQRGKQPFKKQLYLLINIVLLWLIIFHVLTGFLYWHFQGNLIGVFLCRTSMFTRSTCVTWDVLLTFTWTTRRPSSTLLTRRQGVSLCPAVTTKPWEYLEWIR